MNDCLADRFLGFSAAGGEKAQFACPQGLHAGRRGTGARDAGKPGSNVVTALHRRTPRVSLCLCASALNSEDEDEDEKETGPPGVGYSNGGRRGGQARPKDSSSRVRLGL